MRDAVRSEQFTPVSRLASPEDSGNEQTETVWSRGQALVRLTRDRGQWWCDLSLAGWTEWFDVDVVAGFFQSKEQGVEKPA